MKLIKIILIILINIISTSLHSKEVEYIPTTQSLNFALSNKNDKAISTSVIVDTNNLILIIENKSKSQKISCAIYFENLKKKNNDSIWIRNDCDVFSNNLPFEDCIINAIKINKKSKVTLKIDLPKSKSIILIDTLDSKLKYNLSDTLFDELLKRTFEYNLKNTSQKENWFTTRKQKGTFRLVIFYEIGERSTKQNLYYSKIFYVP